MSGVDGVQWMHEASIAEHGDRAAGIWACVLDTGATEALVGKSTSERNKEYVSSARPNLNFVEEPGATKSAVTIGDTGPVWRGQRRRCVW